MLEHKVKHIEYMQDTEPEWLMVTRLSGNTLELYASYVNRRLMHEDIVRKLNLPGRQVIGGGRLIHRDSVLAASGYSKAFGPIPNEVMDRFMPLICSELKGRLPIDSYTVDMRCMQGLSGDDQFLRWENLGCSFDTKFMARRL